MELIGESSGEVKFALQVYSDASSLQAMYLGQENNFFEIRIENNVLRLNIFDEDFFYWTGTQYVGGQSYTVPITNGLRTIGLSWDTDGTELTIDGTVFITTPNYITLDQGSLILGREYKTTYANLTVSDGEQTKLDLPLQDSLENKSLGVHESFPVDLTHVEPDVANFLDVRGTGNFYYSLDLGETWVPATNLTAIPATDEFIFLKQEIQKGDFLQSVNFYTYATRQQRDDTDKEKLLTVTSDKLGRWENPISSTYIKGVAQVNGDLGVNTINFAFRPLSAPTGMAYLFDSSGSYVRFNEGTLETGPNVISVRANYTHVTNVQDVLRYGVWTNIQIVFTNVVDYGFFLSNELGEQRFDGLIDDIHDLTFPPVETMVYGNNVIRVTDRSQFDIEEIRAEVRVDAWESTG